MQSKKTKKRGTLNGFDGVRLWGKDQKETPVTGEGEPGGTANAYNLSLIF